jgi:hypothetical protein
MVVGFLLTGVIGTAVTQYFTSQHKEHQRIQKLAEERKEVVAKLSSLNAEHLASAEQLLSALERGKSTDKLAEMRELYEAATRRWRTESHPALMIAREVLPEDAYYTFRDRLRNEVQRRFMEPFGDCLGRASLAQAGGESVADVLADCRARDHLEQAGRCGETLMDMFYDLAASTVEKRDEEWLREKRELHGKRVEDACALPTQTVKR